ncbi:Palmitoyltransferase zdhhc6 [Sparganum proliferum]
MLSGRFSSDCLLLFCVGYQCLVPSSRMMIEQLKQKEAKSRIAREVVIHRAYSGGLLAAFAFGPRVACCFPWSGEGQLRVQVGDRVLVTRSYRRWIYGQLLVNPDQQNGSVVKHNPRGWFPRACTKETQPKSKSI